MQKLNTLKYKCFHMDAGDIGQTPQRRISTLRR